MLDSSYQILLDKLNEFIRKYYKNQLLRGVIYTTGLTLLFFIAAAYAEYFAHFDTSVRTILFYSFITLNGFVLYKYIVVPSLKLYKIGPLLSYQQAAEIIGKHFTNVQDKLLNVLQLQQQYGNIPTEQNPQIDLLQAGINQKIKELKPVPFVAAIDFKENIKYLRFALIPLLLIVITLFSAPKIITDSSKRLVKYNQHFEKEAPFKFEIVNKSLTTVAQQDFELNVKLTGEEVPENIYININGNEFKLDKQSTINFSYLFKNIQQTITFYLTGDGYNSVPYELKALPNPVLLNFDITLNYPAYLHKKNETIENTGDISIPAGTRITWNFHTQNTQLINLIFDDSVMSISPAKLNNFSYSARFLKNKQYAITTSNEYFKNKDAVNYTIDVIPDEYPVIEVEKANDSVLSNELYFAGQIQDDYGFNKLTFNYRFINENDVSNNEKFKQLTTNSTSIKIDKNTTSNPFFFHWNINEIGIAPGDQIEYYFEVWDNDGVSGSKATRSDKTTFKVPSLQELEAKTEQKNEQIKSNLEHDIRSTKDIQKEINELQRRLTEKKELSWEEKKKLENLLDKQKQLQEKIEKTKNENIANNKQQSEYKKTDESILQKQKQLEELFEKILTPELKEKMNELQQLLQQMDKNKVQEALEKMKFENKDLLKELDRNLEIFKQLEVEQKLQDNINKLNQLAEKQNELAQKAEDKKTNNEELKNKQNELNKEFDNIKKDMDELEQKNKELEEAKPIENTQQQQQDIDQQMKESSEQLNKNDKKNAARSQKNAAQKMKEMADRLSSMQAQMEQQQQGEDINQLRSILDNLIQLSFEQEALMNELSKTNTSSPQYFKISQQQKKLHDDAQIIEDSLFALSKRAPQIEAVVNKEISNINMNMEKAIADITQAPSPSYDGKNYKREALSRQQYAMTSINNLALMLNEALLQMQEQVKQQGQPGSGSCKKTGGKGSKPSAATLRQMQQQLNEQIKKLKESIDKKSGQGSGGGGNAGMSKELAKLAAEQESIRKQLQKLSDELNKNGNNNGSNLQKLTEIMEQTETDLVNKTISQETIKRQEEILTRLLESEKAEQEREQDEKRQSNEAKNENYSNQNLFLEYKGRKKKEEELLKTIPPSLKPFFKAKANQYFNNFEE